MNQKKADREKLRIYSAPLSHKFAIGVAAIIAAAFVSLSFYFFRKQTPVATAHEEPRARNESVLPPPAAPAANEELGATKKFEPPPSPSPVPARTPAPVSPETKYDVTLESVNVTQIESLPGQVQAEMSFNLTEKTRNPDVLAVLMQGKFTKIELDNGQPVKLGLFHVFGIDTTIQKKHAGSFSIVTNLPDSVKTLRLVEGSALVISAAKRQNVEWTGLANARGQSRSIDGYEFTLAAYSQSGQSAEADIQYKYPAIAPFEPVMWPSSFVRPALRLSDGTYATTFGAGGGGLGENIFQINSTFFTAGKTPAVLEVGFVSAIKQEEAVFSFKDVKIPEFTTPARMPGVPLGARGPKTVKSEGYQFLLQNAVLKQDKRPCLEIHLLVIPPAGALPLVSPRYVTEGVGTDNLGVTLREFDEQPFMRETLAKGTPVLVRFPLPDGKAERLAVFSGKYDVFIADETRSVEFALPPNSKDLTEAISTPPVTLDSVAYTGGFAAIKVRIDGAALSHPAYCSYSVAREMQNGSGQLLENPAGGCQYLGGKISFTDRFLAVNNTPAKVVIRYTSKGHLLRIPFEFKDVGLPRTIGNEIPKKQDF